MAGRYPHNTGAAELHTPLPEGMPTIAGELKKAGYYTAASGKWHMGPHAKADFDYEDLFTAVESIHRRCRGGYAVVAMVVIVSIFLKDKIYDNLLKYCELDTLAMVRIWEKLREM